MTLRIPCIALAIAVVLGPRYCATDVIIDWNNELLETIRSGSIPPPPATRVMAMINTAMYDAVNSVAGTHVPYHFVPTTAPAPLTSTEAAATQAAYRVMVTAFPANQSVYDAALAESLSRIADGPDKTTGIELSDAAGAAILSLRAWRRTPAYLRSWG